MTRRPQFSIRLLLLTVAAVAVVLALMVQMEQQHLASASLVLLTIVGLAFSTVALIFGRDAVRPFGVGAVIPLVWSSFWVVTRTEGIATLFEPSEYGMIVSLYSINQTLGSAILTSIVLGYLCVWFRWLIEPAQPPESSP